MTKKDINHFKGQQKPVSWPLQLVKGQNFKNSYLWNQLMDFIFKSFDGSIIPKRTSINKECQFLVVNKRSRAILWFLKKYPSQRCGTFVRGWYFMSNNRHVSFFIGKHTFQNQKPAARLITPITINATVYLSNLSMPFGNSISSLTIHWKLLIGG